MRIELDENLPGDVVEVFTRRGHDVERCSTSNSVGRRTRSSSKPQRMTVAWVITLDRGVGDIRRFPPGSQAGVVVLRPISQDPGSICELVDRLLDAHELEAFNRCVVIVEPRRVRVRRPEE